MVLGQTRLSYVSIAEPVVIVIDAALVDSPFNHGDAHHAFEL
jgi:hypothetical protein